MFDNGFIRIFKNQGGMQLIRQYHKSGALFTAFGEFCLLGKSSTALELLRLSAQLKAKQTLEKRYRHTLEAFEQQYDAALPHLSSNKVWICWFQGMDTAPEIVKKCCQSVRENLPDRDIVVITRDTIGNYVRFPDYIQEKIDAGLISGAHLSDLIRVELLTQYGGTWMDATVYLSGKPAAYFFDSELFMFQNLKPGKDGNASVISNWFITARSHNHLLEALKYLLYLYWKDSDEVLDYFFFHELFQIVIERYPEEWNEVIPCSNSTPHILLLRLFDPFQQEMWDAITQQTCIHKLSYKFSADKTALTNTYYRAIMGEH